MDTKGEVHQKNDKLSGERSPSAATSCRASFFSSFTFHHGDFLGRQAVELIHQLVNLRLRRINLTL